MKRYVAAALCMSVASAAQAGGTFDSTGTVTGQSTSTIHALHEGHLVLELRSTHDEFQMAAADHPFSGMSGSCTGAAEIRGASATGGGMCVYTGADGSMAANRWTVTGLGADGAFEGRWVMVSGNGTMEGLTGGGTYRSLTNPETGAQKITLTGAVSKP